MTRVFFCLGLVLAANSVVADIKLSDIDGIRVCPEGLVCFLEPVRVPELAGRYSNRPIYYNPSLPEGAAAAEACRRRGCIEFRPGEEIIRPESE